MHTGVKRRDTGVNKKTIQPVHVCKGREAASSSLHRATILLQEWHYNEEKTNHLKEN